MPSSLPLPEGRYPMERGISEVKDHGSLNACPFNMEAERLAMEDCMYGLDVRREWAETEMVSQFGGGMLPGTPDGMFEEWEADGNKSRLTCVQVVRAPIHPTMNFAQIEEVLYQTVLTKIWKSQIWMKSTQTLPDEFIIFLWLPFQAVEGTAEKAQSLIERCREDRWPFVLRCKVPAEPGSLFPLKFAYQGAGREGGMESRCVKKRHRISETDLSTFDPNDFDENSEDEMILPDLFEDTSQTSTDELEDSDGGTLPDLLEDSSSSFGGENATVTP